MGRWMGRSMDEWILVCYSFTLKQLSEIGCNLAHTSIVVDIDPF